MTQTALDEFVDLVKWRWNHQNVPMAVDCRFAWASLTTPAEKNELLADPVFTAFCKEQDRKDIEAHALAAAKDYQHNVKTYGATVGTAIHDAKYNPAPLKTRGKVTWDESLGDLGEEDQGMKEMRLRAEQRRLMGQAAQQGPEYTGPPQGNHWLSDVAMAALDY